MKPGIAPESIFWPEPIGPVHSKAGEAIELLEASVARGATVIAIGPLTNLAAFEAIRPGRLARVPLFCCGGCLNPAREGHAAFRAERLELMEWSDP